MLEIIVQRFLTLLTLTLPMFLFAIKTKRKKKFRIRVLLFWGIVFLISVVAGISFYYIYKAQNINPWIIWIETFYYLLLFVLLTLLLSLCFDLNIWGLLFCSSAGYCVQHISARLGTIIDMILGDTPVTEPIIPRLYIYFLTTFLSVLVTCLVYLFLVRKIINEDTIEKLANPRQVLIATVVSFVMVGYNSFGLSFVSSPYYSETDNEFFKNCYIYGTVFVCVTSIMIAFLCLVVELSWYIGGRLIHQKETLLDMLEEQKKSFSLEQEATETLNTAVHDIRHLLKDFGEDIDSTRRERILKTVETYDSIVKTGNKAIDVILTKKSLFCTKNDIRLTCCLDGKSFDFMEPHELYSLFENALDNAVEAVSVLPSEKRNISVTEKKQGMFICLRVENYCLKKVGFKDGLPVADNTRKHHGYGMMSMDMIARKYNGRIEARQDGELFTLEIFLINGME